MSSTKEDSSGTRHRNVSEAQSNVVDVSNNAPNEQQNAVGLEKRVGLIGGISMIIGTIIGSGIFISPKGVAAGSGSVALTLINWGLCGIVSTLGALCYAELGTLIPKSGAEYPYLEVGFGPIMAFLFSWTSVTVIKPCGIAVVAITCAEYLLLLFFTDDCGNPPIGLIKILAVFLMLLLCAINCYSVDLATHIQVIFTLAKIIALCIIIVGGIVRICQGYTEHLSTGFEGTETDVGLVILGLYGGMFAYDGWNNLNYCTEELQNPNRNLPLAILIGMPLVTVIYVLVNVSYFTVMSVEDMLASPAVAVTWAEAVIPKVVWIIPLSVAMSTFGGCNGGLFSCGRLNYVAARKGHLLKILSMVHVRRSTPLPSVIFTTVLTILFIIPGNISSLVDLFSFAVWFFYGATVSALLVLRVREPYKSMHRPYQVPLIFPLIVLLAAAILVIVPLVLAPQIEFLYALLFIVGGLVFYFPFVYLKKELPFIERLNVFFQLLYEVSPAENEKMLIG